MKNKKIKVGDTVPAPLRRKIYRQAIEAITKGVSPIAENKFNICFLLPCLLWGNDSIYDPGPNDTDWDLHDSYNMFLEWTEKRRDEIFYRSGDKNKNRIEILTEMIHESRRKNS